MLTQIYDGALREVGITSTQFSFLEAIGTAPGLRTRDLASILAMDSTTVTRSLKLLETGGWVRMAGGADLREKRWVLTRSGKAKLASARPRWQKAQDHIVRLLGQPQADQLQELSYALVTKLNE